LVAASDERAGSQAVRPTELPSAGLQITITSANPSGVAIDRFM